MIFMLDKGEIHSVYQSVIASQFLECCFILHSSHYYHTQKMVANQMCTDVSQEGISAIFYLQPLSLSPCEMVLVYIQRIYKF